MWQRPELSRIPATYRSRLAAITIAFCTAFTGATADASLKPGAIRTDRVLIKLTAAALSEASHPPDGEGLPQGLIELDSTLAQLGISRGRRLIGRTPGPLGSAERLRASGLDRWYRLELRDSGTNDFAVLLRRLRAVPWIESVEPIQAAMPMLMPDDPELSQQWHHYNYGQTGGTIDADIDTPEAWDIETGDAGTIIAVIDEGYDLFHEDLVDNFMAGWDFGENDPDPHDPEQAGGHATTTSGIAGARGDNSIGVAGLCWSCKIMPLRISGDSDQVAPAIVFAADHGADVINMSLAWDTTWFQSILDATDYALSQGTLAVAASGNYYGYYPWTPGALPNTVAVGATDHEDRWTFSSYGDLIDVAAPGLLIYTTFPSNEYHNSNGTSSASPVVAGLAGLLRSADPDLHVNELRHLLRLGADDEVGDPAQDTPGWDQWSGYGRVNARGSLELVPGPWLALDRPHYICAGDITVALKETGAGASEAVTLTGSIGGDSEVVTVLPLTGGGYYEGDIPIAWAGRDGPVVVGDGKLDLQHDEWLTASIGALSAQAFVECRKRVCRSGFYRPRIIGDCDLDGAADPGELWTVDLPLFNGQTELLEDAVAVLTSTNPDVELINDTTVYGDVPPFPLVGSFAANDGDHDPVRFRVRAGAAVNGTAGLSLQISGRGWESDDATCALDGHPADWVVPVNRDIGTPIQQWTFPDQMSADGFTHQLAHGTGDLSECSPSSNPWQDLWNDLPATDRFHSGAGSLRYGDGIEYSPHQDGGMVTPELAIPPGGGALGFYAWMETANDLLHPGLSWHGMVIETKPTKDSTWSFLREATYNADQRYTNCRYLPHDFPFGSVEVVDMFAGDGAGTMIDGDTFDREHLADLSAFAGGESIQVRFRFGSDNPSEFITIPDEQGPWTGVWLDTITLYGTWAPDSWPGSPPASLQGSQAGCPDTFELSWDPVAGAAGYAVYRSDVSCADAAARPDAYGSSPTTSFMDEAIYGGLPFFYAVEALESGQGCPTERSCVPGCPCSRPSEATNLLLERQGADVLMTWDDPDLVGLSWNIYRDTVPDPSGWGTPHAEGVDDAEPATTGIQYYDPGAVGDPASHYYLVNAVNGCGESPR